SGASTVQQNSLIRIRNRQHVTNLRSGIPKDIAEREHLALPYGQTSYGAAYLVEHLPREQASFRHRGPIRRWGPPMTGPRIGSAAKSIWVHRLTGVAARGLHS